MAFQIIRHAFRIIFGNLGQALRVSVGPFVILTIVMAPMVTFIADGGGLMEGGSFAGDQPMRPAAVMMIVLLIAAFLFVFSWIAVSWHRFILLEEYTTILPPITGRPIWPYLGRSLLYGLALGLLAIPLMIVLSLAAVPMVNAGGALGAFFIFIVVTVFFGYMWLRIAIALPSVAVGRPITMRDAWRASARLSGTILGVAVLLVVINAIGSLISTQVAAVLPLFGTVLDIALQWLVLMLGVSMLTTLYGHLIEGRELPA